MKNSTIISLNRDLSNKTIIPQKIYDTSLLNLKKINKDFNCSLRTVPFCHFNNSNSLLNGIVYSLKDNIATKDIVTTGGSLFLKEYIPKYDAFVKKTLDEAGAICLSKDNLDEFGLGGTGTYSAYGIVPNPFDKTRIAGGSSSGSSVMVSKKIVTFAIATDTGDSIRKPASFQGIVGFKPSYGAISRYGVFPYAPSLDHVGILANSVLDIAIVYSTLAKQDKHDMTSINLSNDYFSKIQETNIERFKLVLLKDAYNYMNKQEKKEFDKYLSKLKTNFEIHEIDFGLDLLSMISSIYRSLSYSEAASCWSNLTGLLFGECENGNNFQDIAIKSRTNLFGKQLKQRFVIGAYVTSRENFENIFLKSKSIRTLIIERAKAIFEDYDAFILPGASSIAPLIDDVLKNNSSDNICDDALQIANFAGLPSITIPAISVNKLPLGINITADYKQDLKVLKIAYAIEKIGAKID